MTSNLGFSNVNSGNVFMSVLPYVYLSFRSSLPRSCWCSGPVSMGPPDARSLVLYSLILSTMSFCTGPSSLLNAPAVTPVLLLKWTETADWMREEKLKSLWSIRVILTCSQSWAARASTASTILLLAVAPPPPAYPPSQCILKFFSLVEISIHVSKH